MRHVVKVLAGIVLAFAIVIIVIYDICDDWREFRSHE